MNLPEARRPLASRSTRWAAVVSRAAVRAGLSADGISILSLVFAGAGAAALLTLAVPWNLLAGAVCVLSLYRGISFIHELTHLRRDDVPFFHFAWNVLIGVPWMLAFALRADGWYLRQDIVWSKPNPMPESVTDRCTKSHEYIFLLSKSPRYYCDMEAIKERAVDPIPGNVQQQRLPGEREGENANLRNGLHAYAERQRSKRRLRR